MKDKDKYFVETENLAFPEIHTGKVKQISSEKPNADESDRKSTRLNSSHT